jgi:hypothetical protein
MVTLFAVTLKQVPDTPERFVVNVYVPETANSPQAEMFPEASVIE